MSSSKTYQTKYYIRFFTFIVFSIFIFFYRIKKKLPLEVKNLKPPYLILSNHVGHWDPFIVGHFLPKFTHFVASDAAFRSRIAGFFLTRLGTIPKKKNIRDTKVIRDIVSVIRQKENVGIFPEAVRNWAGLTFTIDPSIVKLIRLLNVPVVVAVLKGMNLFNPRWSPRIRNTRVEVTYEILLASDEIKLLTDSQIMEKLSQSLYHDEIEYQRNNMNKIYCKFKAENISHALYICPDCYAIDSFISSGNNFWCTACNYSIHIDKYGFFERKGTGKLHFNNIRDWYIWEESWLLQYVGVKFDSQFSGIIFKDRSSKIYHSKSNKRLHFIGVADINLYINRIEVQFIDKEVLLVFNFDELQTINPQVNDRLEVYYHDDAYRIIGSRRGVSALKWEVAMNAIWKKMGQLNKLSAYIPQHIEN